MIRKACVAEWDALPDEDKRHYENYHRAKLDSEFSAKAVARNREDAGAANKPFITATIPGPESQQVTVVKHLVGTDAASVLKKRLDCGKRLHALQWTLGICWNRWRT